MNSLLRGVAINTGRGQGGGGGIEGEESDRKSGVGKSCGLVTQRDDRGAGGTLDC